MVDSSHTLEGRCSYTNQRCDEHHRFSINFDERIMKLLTVLLLAGTVTGCSNIHPHEPEPQTLFQQIPNWDGEAMSVCAGHLPPEQRLPHQSGRC